MSLLDLLTGGETSQAQQDLENAQQDIRNVQTPTQAQLTLPELQQYVNAGLMTPAQAVAALQGSNAFDTIQNDQSTTEAEKTALGQMQQVAADQGMTPQMQAQLTAALNQANTNTQGQRASILDSLAQRGIPTSLMAAAAQQAAAGQDAQTANLVGAQAAGQAEQNALTAMANAGTLAGNINAQEYGQQANRAAAQNAINQWNAQNQTQVNEANAGRTQAANLYNTENSQNVANQNTGLANERTRYNAYLPETIFANQMQKAGAEAGVFENQANQAMQAGQQQAGLIGGLIGGASQIGAAAAAPTMEFPNVAGWGNGPPPGVNTQQYAPPGFAEGGEVRRAKVSRTHDGGVYVADDGGNVPGHPVVPGDSVKNDRIHALLSPGEVVIPRTISHNPDRVKQFVTGLLKQPRPIRPVHPDDLHGMLEALTRRREQEA